MQNIVGADLKGSTGGRIRPITGALIAGVVVFAAAVLWGAMEVTIVSVLAYRSFRKRPPLTYSLSEGVEHAADSLLGKLGKVIVGPASGASLVIRGAELGAVAYFGYRMLEKRRSERKSSELRAPEAVPLLAD